jgi:hypothetical protein
VEPAKIETERGKQTGRSRSLGAAKRQRKPPDREKQQRQGKPPPRNPNRPPEGQKQNHKALPRPATPTPNTGEQAADQPRTTRPHNATGLLSQRTRGRGRGHAHTTTTTLRIFGITEVGRHTTDPHMGVKISAFKKTNTK